jgi:hypothetical protein
VTGTSGTPGAVAVARVTLRALMMQPGRLATEFTAGIRRIGPVTLFVCAALTYSAVRIVAERVAPAELSAPGMDPALRGQLDDLPMSAESRDLVISLYEHRHEIARTTAWESSAVMVCLVPVFALLMQLAYAGAHRPYGAHLAFSLDYFAAILFGEALASVVDPLNVTALSVLAGLALLTYVSWYTIEAMRAFYGGTTGATILKATIVSLGYLAVYTASMTGAAALTLYLTERSQ